MTIERCLPSVLAALAVASCRVSVAEAPRPPMPADARSTSGAGARHDQAVVASEEEAGFAGAWTTTYGAMRLEQSGARVRGTYAYGERSTIEGEVEGRLLRATYAEPDGTRGRALFALSPDGSSFEGVWRAGADAPLAIDDADAPGWHGERVEPVPGRSWLVILEANWESSLAEPEYSYGAMLRTWFARVPDVEVRHRTFHDEADFVRLCRDLEWLVEPVFLYVSSHGDPDGLVAPGGTVGAEAIARALGGVERLELLHLGACSALGGDLAARICAARAGLPCFPISGFRTDVDWAGSAIVDLAYLTLVLEHGLASSDAAREVRETISFARAATPEGAPIPGVDLAVVDPP